jgi:hypothetical protein
MEIVLTPAESHEGDAEFIAPMVLQRCSDLPDGPEWRRELEV